MGTASETMFLLLLCLIPLASGHGGMMWPPSWWDSRKVPLEEQKSWHGDVSADPPVIDPSSRRPIEHIKQWLTDRVYLGGIGKEYENYGDMSLTTSADCKGINSGFCWRRAPWSSPGHAPSLGGGCGVFGGNPWGCPAGKDDRPKGSACGQDKSIGRGMRGTSSFGTDARLFDFPQMITTEWQIGSIQDVVWTSTGSHRGGYTYRLCKMPEGGRSSIEEECFTKNVLKFATNFTMIKAMGGKYGKGEWEKFEQTDLSEGTYPEGSVWRPVGKYVKSELTLRKDSVVVPSTLAPGDYVL